MKTLRSIFIAISLSTLCAVSLAQEVPVTLEDIWTSRVLFPDYAGDMRASERYPDQYYSLDQEGLSLYAYSDGRKKLTVMRYQDLKVSGQNEPLDFDDYSLSSDETKVLLINASEEIYRYSVNCEYYIWDIPAKKLSKLSEQGKQRYAEISPDGRMVAFARDNNIFLKDLGSGTETAVTSDGRFNHIINGTTDWVYEEELDLVHALWWSPDGSKLAFYRFDESLVPEFTLPIYGSLYPKNYTYKYPKAGEPNSVVSIHVYDLNSGKTQKMDVGSEADQYIPRIFWMPVKDQLAIIRMNRLQNHVEMLRADANTGESKVVWEDKNQYYIDVSDDFYFSEDGKFFIGLSERSAYNHVWLFYLDGRPALELTPGKFDVTAINAVDMKSRQVFYTAAAVNPMDRELYVCGFDGKKPVCLSKSGGQTSAEFSADYNYFVSTWSDVNTPPYVSICDRKGKDIRVITDNQRIVARLRSSGAAKKEFFRLANEQGDSLNAWMLKPPGFDPSKKYPVLMYTYGGPGSQTADNSWGYFYHLFDVYLSQLGYIIVSVDGRGTGARGEEFKKCTYQQLGRYEADDQIAAAYQLAEMPFVDPGRIGIWGWSYGGFLTALCLEKGDGIFKAGIAVAPVTSWRYYDNIYTERFMRTPAENPRGYDDNSPLYFADRLQGSFLLVHGTADNNVHMQNSLELSKALVDAGKDFEMFFYTDKEHSIKGGKTRLHLFRKITEFLQEHL